jgi:hypothetical protein
MRALTIGRVLTIGVLAFSALALITDPALALRRSPGQIKKLCASVGGVYFPPNNRGVYGCMVLDSDGSMYGLVCGGTNGDCDGIGGPG